MENAQWAHETYRSLGMCPRPLWHLGAQVSEPWGLLPPPPHREARFLNTFEQQKANCLPVSPTPPSGSGNRGRPLLAGQRWQGCRQVT